MTATHYYHCIMLVGFLFEVPSGAVYKTILAPVAAALASNASVRRRTAPRIGLSPVPSAADAGSGGLERALAGSAMAGAGGPVSVEAAAAPGGRTGGRA